MRLSEFFRKYAKGRGVTMAEALKVEIRKVLSVRAPTRTTRSGRLVATTKAKAFAPPRIVSEKLRKSVKVTRTVRGAKVTVYAPYSVPLEYSTYRKGYPHRFLSVALGNLGLKGRNA